jgi:hypothetical protein
MSAYLVKYFQYLQKCLTLCNRRMSLHCYVTEQMMRAYREMHVLILSEEESRLAARL